MSAPLLIARTLDKQLHLLPAMANRHGLITGATGTGKTVTLQKLAESFSEIGVPVFMADVKGDLTGIAESGQSSEKLQARLKNKANEAKDYLPAQYAVIEKAEIKQQGKYLALLVSPNVTALSELWQQAMKTK